MSEPTIEDVAKGDPHLEASPNAVYRCGVRDALRAVLRDFGELTYQRFEKSYWVNIRDVNRLEARIRATVGE